MSVIKQTLSSLQANVEDEEMSEKTTTSSIESPSSQPLVQLDDAAKADMEAVLDFARE